MKKIGAEYIINIDLDGYDDVISKLFKMGIHDGFMIDGIFIFPGKHNATEARVMARDWFQKYDGNSYYETLDELYKALRNGKYVSLADYINDDDDEEGKIIDRVFDEQYKLITRKYNKKIAGSANYDWGASTGSSATKVYLPSKYVILTTSWDPDGPPDQKLSHEWSI